ncbi:hypothetical protein V5O48_006580 [Marasmius crinis-equi]|uniref:Uncharacterized protein n=1 Tax=Marasmius crinis-equi TaxID=585013 RepID=A0ABR3FJB7_9AGAR
MALILPELIFLWALREWFAARATATKYARYGWGSMSHGFFINMGGLALGDDDGRFLCYLWDSDVISEDNSYTRRQLEIVETWWEEGYGRREPPVLRKSTTAQGSNGGGYSCLLEYLLAERRIALTKEDIQDRSRADSWSKAILILQTVLFILQCMRHVLNGISLAEVEVLTIALVTLNFGTFFLWWSKPQGVRYPEVINVSIFPTRPITAPAQQSSVFKVIWQWFSHDFLATQGLFGFWIFVPLAYPFLSLLMRTMNLVFDADDYQAGHLYSSKLKTSPPRLYFSVYTSAVLFGGLHLISWSFVFPTMVERDLWRTCAVVITISPIAVAYAWHFTQYRAGCSSHPSSLRAAVWKTVLQAVLLLAPALYVVAKVILIAIALSALRPYPSDVHDQIQDL